MANNEKTSNKVAKIASELLRDPKTPKKVKAVAASALTQASDKKKRSNFYNAGFRYYHNTISLHWSVIRFISEIMG